ncbi:MAG: hypothetical protein J0H52_09760 [Comamonadaceae bacterium]|nr:hypothetical protein [Comamonadaceae bacterium]MBN9366382.1 hypothetical protein [Comamonadaceae bacterium]
MTRHPLHAALRAALLSRNVHQVRALRATHGLPAFAAAVAGCPPRVAADALSLLPLDDRDAVLRHLPRPVRDSLRPLGIVPAAPQPACRLGWGLLAWRGA